MFEMGQGPNKASQLSQPLRHLRLNLLFPRPFYGLPRLVNKTNALAPMGKYTPCVHVLDLEVSRVIRLAVKGHFQRLPDWTARRKGYPNGLD